MEEVTGYIALFLMLIFFIGLVILEFLLSKTFNKLYSGSKKMMFWNKITWLQNNSDSFDHDDQEKAKRIVIFRKFLIFILAAMFVFYFIGNLAK